MFKTLFTLTLTILLTLICSQPLPREAKNGDQTTSTIPQWTCAFTFSFNEVSVFTENLSQSSPNVGRSNFGLESNDNIDSVSWEGNSCFCWLLLYQETGYSGYRGGIWIGSRTGTIDLTSYLVELSDNVEDEGEDDNSGSGSNNSGSGDDDVTSQLFIDNTTGDNSWIQWDKDLSSYRIYCF